MVRTFADHFFDLLPEILVRPHPTFKIIETVDLDFRLQLLKEKIILVIRQVIEIIAILSLLYWGTEVTWKIHQWIMPAMEISRSYVYGACPVGSFFMLLYALRDFITELKRKRYDP